ncbi:cytochrome P450 CYP82D47-like [Gossypium australe]|uniref:Cytochrome P450 CYP82D47-like n=1 Tax=Gossypium australe TaxID=47621 RepID=A0A5B6W6A2_9ROSI|nr:cytochrome P450 CYP82D47-like [Gossypium australe]
MELFDIPYLSYYLVLIAITTLFFYTKLKRSDGKAAPEAGGAWPIIGHLPLLGKPVAAHVTLGALADKLGPAFMIRLGVHPALVVSSREVAKEIFTTNDMAVSSRSKMAAAEHMGYNYAMFGFSPYGQYWREMRKITMLEVLSNHRIDQLKKVFVSEIEGSIKDLYKFWVKEKDGESGLAFVEMKKRFLDLTLNVILRTVAGKRYSGVGKEEQQVVSRYRKALRDFFYLSGIFVIGDAIPFLRKLDLGGYEKWMKKTAQELDDIAEGWLNDHRRDGYWDESKKEKDFMDVMNSVLKGADLAGYDADTINKATSLQMILAGSDTTTVTLIWALSCTIGGYEIPKGTRLIINLHKIQRDPKVWSEPSEFMPERFLTTYKDVDVRGQHFELMPFGSGRRSCPGTSFALQMLHLTLSNFLHAFEFSTPDKGLIDLTGTVGLTDMKSTPLETVISPLDMSEAVGLMSPKATPLEVYITPRIPTYVYL